MAVETTTIDDFQKIPLTRLDQRIAGIDENAEDSTYSVESLKNFLDNSPKSERGLSAFTKRSSSKIGDAPINIIGNSIAQGSYIENTYENGWTRLLGRSVNNEFGGSSYGFVPPSADDCCTISFGGSWQTNLDENASEILQGVSYTNLANEIEATITVPSFQERVRVWYVKKPEYGLMALTVNGVYLTTVDTSGTTDYNAYIDVNIVDNGAGKCVVIVGAVSAANPIEFCGISLLTGTGVCVNNFSKGGRALINVSENSIAKAIEGATAFILMCSYNDFGLTDPVLQAEFEQRINWIIQYANLYNTKVIITNDCWQADDSNFAVVLLKHCANSCNGGIYIDLPALIKNNQDIVLDNEYMVNNIKMFIDAAHPNIDGSAMIFEFISKAMGLSVTSKKEVLKYCDYWFPFYFADASPFKNTLTDINQLSAYRLIGDTITVRLAIETKNALPIPAGDHLIQSNYAQSYLWGSQASWTVTDVNGTTGAINNRLYIDLAGLMAISSITPSDYKVISPAIQTLNPGVSGL